MSKSKTLCGTIMAAGLLIAGSGLSTAQANCPTPQAKEAVAKYIAVYNQNPLNAGSSWRLYARPRKGACLAPAKTGFQSPTRTPGQSDGKKTSATIHDGAHNCTAKYKSYISVDVPSPQAVYDTYTKYTTTDGKPQPTLIGWQIENTKAKGPTYDGVIFVVPAKNRDGSPSNTQVNIAGVCIQ